MAHILVVDDNDITRKMYVFLLETESHDVVVAEDGLEGLQNARQGAFDLVVTDYDMPNMKGDALSVELKKLKPAMPILMVSGDPEPFGHKADSFLAKPFKGVEFLDMVEALLGTY